MLYQEPPENFSPSFEVVSCFVICQGKILLLHRANHKPEGGTWGTVAGKMDLIEIDGAKQIEQPLTAITREMQEETSQSISEEKFCYHKTLYVRYPYRDFTYHIFSLDLASFPGIHLRENEHCEYTWVTPNEAIQLPLIADMREVIEGFFHLEGKDYTDK